MQSKDFWLSIDSGAHSWFENFIKDPDDASFRTNKNLDYSVIRSRLFKSTLDKYIGYLHTVGEDFRMYVTLDVLGHPKYSWDILKYMESNGLHPIPAFHLFEDFSWLSKMIDNYEYIGVGVVNKGNLAAPFQGWIEKVFKQYVQQADGTPRVKIHGFAANALDILKQYPFYSCDASTWSFGARLGHVQIPNFIIKNNEIIGYDYFPHQIKSLPLTERRVSDTGHYLKLSSSNKELLNQYFLYLGADIELLQKEYFERDYVNALFFINAEKELKNHYKEKFNFEQGGNIYLAGTASSSSNTIPGLHKLIDRIFKREESLKFLLSYWYHQYANTCIAIKRSIDDNKFDKEYIPEYVKVKKSIMTECDLEKKHYEIKQWNTVHLEDLELTELNNSHTTDKEFKAGKLKIKTDALDLKLKQRETTKLTLLIRPVKHLVKEVVEKVVKEVVEEVVEEILVTPLISLSDITLLVPADTSIKDLNNLVDMAIKKSLGIVKYQLVSLQIKEKP